MFDNYLNQFEKIITPKTHSLMSIQSNSNSNRHKFYEKEMSNINSKSNSRCNSNFNPLTKSTNTTTFTSPRINLNSLEITKNNLNLIEEEGNNSVGVNKLYPNNSQRCDPVSSPTNNSFFMNFRNCADVESLKEIINEEKKKNMNYRQEINELYRKLELLEKKAFKQESEIEVLKQEKEMNGKYILKMEGMLTVNKNNYNNSDSHNLNPFSFIKKNEDENSLFNHPKFKSLNEEVQTLREFQRKIYEISSSYDEVNENIINTLKEIQELFTNLNEALNERENRRLKEQINFDFRSLDKLKIYFEKIIYNFENSMNTKQDEFNTLLSQKEKENKILSEELGKLKTNFEGLIKDRLTDQKRINELETQIELKSSKLVEFAKLIQTSKYNNDNKIKTQMRNNKDEVKKKVEPAKKSVDRSLKKIKKSFDLKDMSNVRLIERISFYRQDE